VFGSRNNKNDGSFNYNSSAIFGTPDEESNKAGTASNKSIPKIKPGLNGNTYSNVNVIKEKPSMPIGSKPNLSS
jgi:hypothetical protein